MNLGLDDVFVFFAFLLYQVEGVFYVNDALEKLMFEELRNACRGGGKYTRDSIWYGKTSPVPCIKNLTSVFKE